MSSEREGPRPVEPHSSAPSKREYVAPKLEKLGTIRELTRGLGMLTTWDGGHPHGQNKSIG